MFTRIRKRWLLVLAVAAGQTLVLLTGAVWLVYWLDVSVMELLPAADSPAAQAEQTSAVQAFGERVQMIVIMLSAIVVLFSAILTSAIIRQYENRMAAVNENLQELVEVRSRALMKSRHAVIFGLAKLAESRDDETGRHLDRIRAYVTILARELSRTDPSLTSDFIEVLADTSSLHDIGKVGIPDAVLLKPGKLTEDERKIIRRHPLIGGDTLLAIRKVWGDDPFLITACEVTFAHHERWDGSGYPFGLAGDNIPLAGRIVALADVYDALTSKRIYKDAMTHEDAAGVLVSGANAHFDPAVVAAFLARQADFRNVLYERDFSGASEKNPAVAATA